ncbi:chaplin family protein [Streptomyces sp. YGL11-2]|uniref:chaplin family protein n=1 Tax=Streptomyces sp. YGL11-2 TaxID=3414028 RepID=UPI003CEC3E25
MRAHTAVAVVGLTVAALFAGAGAAAANNHDAHSTGNGIHSPGVGSGGGEQPPLDISDNAAGNTGTANNGLNQTFGENGFNG